MKLRFLLLGAAAALFTVASAQAGTLDTVKQRGMLNCGVAPNVPGFAYTGSDGKYHGFDVEQCRAVAAAIFGDANKVHFVPLGPRDAFASLHTGVVDLLAHRFTMTYSRSVGKDGLDFPMFSYIGGQGFMVRKSLKITDLEQLAGASICVAQGTTTEKNLVDYFKKHNIQIKVVTFAGLEEARRAYDAGRCDAWSNDRSSLAARGLNNKNPDENVILPQTISIETAGPVVRKDDPNWADDVAWSIYALLIADRDGVTSKNVDQMRASSKEPEVRRLLGAVDNGSASLGFDKSWGYNVIKQVGNYSEIFKSNIGDDSKLKLSRGPNKTWGEGGELFAPALR